MSDQFDELFANRRRGPWNEDPRSVIQETGSGNGNIAPAGWFADDSITEPAIRTNAIIARHITAGSIETDKLAANSVTAAKIAANSITAAQIAADAITASELAANSVTAENIVAGTITATEIAAGTITASEIAADAITTSELAANAVITENLLAGNVTSSSTYRRAVDARGPADRSLFGRTLPHMERPIDAVTSSVLKLQMAQRAVTALIDDVIERVSVDPFGASSLPDIRLRLSELRTRVDQAADELIDALARMGEAAPAQDSN